MFPRPVVTLFAVTFLSVIILGLVGNMLTLYVYTKSSMRKTTVSFLLNSLSVCNILILLFSLPLYSIPQELFGRNLLKAINFERWGDLVLAIVFPIVNITLTVSRYIMVLIAFERWVEVCRPFQAITHCTRRNCVKSMIGIFTASTILNVPSQFIFKLTYDEKKGFEIKVNMENRLTVLLHQYTTVVSVLFLNLLPFIFLFIANTQVILELRRARLVRVEMTVGQQTEQQTAKLTISKLKEQQMTKMLLSFTMIFGICHFYDMIINLVILVKTEFQILDTERFVEFQISRVLVYVHIGAIFFIYYVFSSPFRTILDPFIRKCLKILKRPCRAMHRTRSIDEFQPLE